MARRPRIHVPGGFYHVTLRGNHRQDIFRDPADRALMESLVAHASREVRARIHAYCWMTNHIHLLVEVREAPLGTLMQRVAGPYARAVHKRFETTGHLFERRHFARLVDTERYLLETIRYTHFNPVRAGLARRPDDYPWSSHHAYLGAAQCPWLTTGFALSMLGATDAEARLAYLRYMAAAEGVTLASPFDADRARPQYKFPDTTHAAAPLQRNAAARVPVVTLEELIREVCASRGISRDEAASRNCARQLSDARTEIARRAVESGVANLSQVARALGRTASALAQSLRRQRGNTAREPLELRSPWRTRSR